MAKQKTTKKKAVAKKPVRKLISEWWEIWWSKPGRMRERVTFRTSSDPAGLPQNCARTREEAMHWKRVFANPGHVVVHVKRYRTEKK